MTKKSVPTRSLALGLQATPLWTRKAPAGRAFAYSIIHTMRLPDDHPGTESSDHRFSRYSLLVSVAMRNAELVQASEHANTNCCCLLFIRCVCVDVQELCCSVVWTSSLCSQINCCHNDSEHDESGDRHETDSRRVDTSRSARWSPPLIDTATSPQQQH